MNRMMPRVQTLLNGENTGHCGQIVLLGILKKNRYIRKREIMWAVLAYLGPCDRRGLF